MTDARIVRATIANRRAGVPSSVTHRRADDRADRRVLLCASPEEYWLWAGRRGEAPIVITGPDRTFCHDSGDPDWCRVQRAAGRCHLTDDEFAAVLRVQGETVSDTESEEEPTMGRLPSLTPEGWEVWTFPGRGTQGPMVAVSKDGTIRVSAAADEAVGHPERVQLLYNPTDRAIAVRACAADAEGAVLLRPRKGGFELSAAGFLRHHRIDHSVTRRWMATVQGRMLIVRLADAPQWEAASA